MKKFFLSLALFLIPFVRAEDCSLLNLGTCLTQNIFEFFLNIFYAPILPFLTLIKNFLTQPIDLSGFMPLWAIIVYVISLFYGILILYAGFNFMISGHDVVKRTKAKQWFQNIIIMIVLVQASYFIYSLVLDVNSLLTSGLINLIDQRFFLLTADNITNLGLEFLFAIFYALTLLITVLILTLRYIIIVVGVAFVPIGIFLYFIPPLQSYGKLIINFLGVCIFSTVLDAVIFLVCAQIVNLSIFDNFKILLMITAFSIANILMFYLMFFSAIKSAFKTGESIAATVVSVAKYFA